MYKNIVIKTIKANQPLNAAPKKTKATNISTMVGIIWKRI